MEAGSSFGGAGHMMSSTSGVPSSSTDGGESSSGDRQLVMQCLLHENHEDQDWEKVSVLHLVQEHPQDQVQLFLYQLDLEMLEHERNHL